MEKATITECEEQITKEDIAKFEIKFQFELPDNYKQLLLNYNGGVNSNDNMVLDQLFSLKHGELTIEEFINDMQILEKNIPRKYLPIGMTGTGNIITLLLEKGSNYGKLFLFRNDLTKHNLANSLEELLGVHHIGELD